MMLVVCPLTLLHPLPSFHIFLAFAENYVTFLIMACAQSALASCLPAESFEMKGGESLMKQVIKITGKAEHVFKYMKVVARYRGNVSLKDLAKDKQTHIIDLN